MFILYTVQSNAMSVARLRTGASGVAIQGYGVIVNL